MNNYSEVSFSDALSNVDVVALGLLIVAFSVFLEEDPSGFLAVD